MRRVVSSADSLVFKSSHAVSSLLPAASPTFFLTRILMTWKEVSLMCFLSHAASKKRHCCDTRHSRRSPVFAGDVFFTEGRNAISRAASRDLEWKVTSLDEFIRFQGNAFVRRRRNPFGERLTKQKSQRVIKTHLKRDSRRRYRISRTLHFLIWHSRVVRKKKKNRPLQLAGSLLPPPVRR